MTYTEHVRRLLNLSYLFTISLKGIIHGKSESYKTYTDVNEKTSELLKVMVVKNYLA